MASKSMLDVLQRKQASYELQSQPLYAFRDDDWKPVTSCSKAAVPVELCLINWNIDSSASQPRARMDSALSYLHKLIAGISRNTCVVIHLQEVRETLQPRGDDAIDLSQIKSAGWVQERFHLAEYHVSGRNGEFGQVSLIDRRLRVARVSCLHLVSEYQRDALVVDLPLSADAFKILRLFNVHLDSSYGMMRPVQWNALAKHGQDINKGVAVSIVAGDCNATQTRDRTACQDVGFKDAYLKLGFAENDESGATWGFQSSPSRWGTQRLDKQVFWGNIRLNSLHRIGIGIQVHDPSAIQELVKNDESLFVTDHYGLMGRYTMT